MSVIITGGLGFVGSHLAEELVNKGYDIVIISRSTDKLSNISTFKNKLKLEKADVTDFDKINDIITKYQPEIIFHLAGQLTSYESFDNPLYDVDVNLKSTVSMLESARSLKSCKFILASTFWVIGKPSSLPVTEESPCWPRNIYAANRLASEHMCEIYNQVYDLDARIIRFTNTYGPREQKENKKKAAINYLLYKAFKGDEVPIYSEGKFFRDLLYVTDAAEAAIKVMEAGKGGEIYFAGSGIKTWFYELAELFRELTNCKIKFIEAPDFHKRIDLGNFVVDNSKLKKLGWEPKVGVKEGLMKILEFYRQTEDDNPNK